MEGLDRRQARQAASKAIHRDRGFAKEARRAITLCTRLERRSPSYCLERIDVLQRSARDRRRATQERRVFCRGAEIGTRQPHLDARMGRQAQGRCRIHSRLPASHYVAARSRAVVTTRRDGLDVDEQWTASTSTTPTATAICETTSAVRLLLLISTSSTHLLPLRQ